MIDFNSPCTIANDDLPEVTAEFIMEAVREMERLQAEREQSGERVDCVVAPVEWFNGIPVVQGPSGPAAVCGSPYIDIGRDRYVFSPECYERIMSYRVDWNIPLQMEWKP